MSKIKRQKRQELRQKRQLHRLHKRQKTSKLQKPLKKNAVFNVTGFLLIIGSLVLFFVGIIAIFGIFGIFGAFVTTLVFTLLGLVIAGGVAGFICCIIGLVGSEKAEKPLRGFGVIGVIIVGIPLLVGLVVLFAALFRFVGLLA